MEDKESSKQSHPDISQPSNPGEGNHAPADGATPRVLVSYAWEDEAYRELVAGLATRLREDGVDARLDLWSVDGRPISDFMASEIRNANKVLMLCSPAYKAKVHAMQDGERATGVGWESALITSEIFSDYSQRRKIIVVVTRGNPWEAIPDGFTGLLRENLQLDPFDQEAYERVYRRLFDEQPQAPALGQRRLLPQADVPALRASAQITVPTLAVVAARTMQARRREDVRRQFRGIEGVRATQAEFARLHTCMDLQLETVRDMLPMRCVVGRDGALNVRMHKTSLSIALHRGPYSNVLDGWRVTVSLWRGDSPHVADLSGPAEQLGMREFSLDARGDGVRWTEHGNESGAYTSMDMTELALDWAITLDRHTALDK